MRLRLLRRKRGLRNERRKTRMVEKMRVAKERRRDGEEVRVRRLRVATWGVMRTEWFGVWTGFDLGVRIGFWEFTEFWKN